MRRAARRDGNEEDLIAVAVKLGAHVVKAGPLDLWVGVPRISGWRPVEIKNKGGQYTLAQREFFFFCSMNGLPYWTWESREDVIRCLSPSH